MKLERFLGVALQLEIERSLDNAAAKFRMLPQDGINEMRRQTLRGSGGRKPRRRIGTGGAARV
jgi:hypothetical protein